MKKFSCLLMSTVIVFSCNQSKKEIAKNADVLADNLKAKAEQTIDSTFKTDGTGRVGDQYSCCVVTQKYDENGYAAHDDSGNVKGVKTTKNGKPLSSILVQLDKDGKYSKAQSLDSTGKMDFYYTDFTQNDYGQITSFKQFKPDSTLKMSLASTFERQLFTGNSVKDSSGKETYSSRIKLDDKNNVVENATKAVTKIQQQIKL